MGSTARETNLFAMFSFRNGRATCWKGMTKGHESAEAFWSEMRMSWTPALMLPCEAGLETAIGPHETSFEARPGTREGVESTAREFGVPVASVLFTAWELLLSRLSGESRFAVGVVFAGREYEELSDVIGPNRESPTHPIRG